MIRWNPNCFTVNIVHMTSQFVHYKVTSGIRNLMFDCTFVYAMNDACERVGLWNGLRAIASSCTGAWVCIILETLIVSLTWRKELVVL